jgi:hypothetical protein
MQPDGSARLGVSVRDSTATISPSKRRRSPWEAKPRQCRLKGLESAPTRCNAVALAKNTASVYCSTRNPLDSGVLQPRFSVDFHDDGATWALDDVGPPAPTSSEPQKV